MVALDEGVKPTPLKKLDESERGVVSFGCFTTERRSPLCHKTFEDASLFREALGADRAIAEEARQEGCRFCEGALHRGDYRRQPRGVPPEMETDEFCTRFSFCCGVCRRRTTPPSVRFLARRVYLAAVVVIVTAARSGLTPERLAALRRLFGVQLSRRTVARWASWWRETFAGSRFWRQARGRLKRPIASRDLPGALVSAFNGRERDRLLSMLRFLGPISTATSRGSMAF